MRPQGRPKMGYWLFLPPLSVADEGERFVKRADGLPAAFNLGVMKNAKRRFEARASVGQARSQDATPPPTGRA